MRKTRRDTHARCSLVVKAVNRTRLFRVSRKKKKKKIFFEHSGGRPISTRWRNFNRSSTRRSFAKLPPPSMERWKNTKQGDKSSPSPSLLRETLNSRSIWRRALDATRPPPPPLFPPRCYIGILERVSVLYRDYFEIERFGNLWNDSLGTWISRIAYQRS